MTEPINLDIDKVLLTADEERIYAGVGFVNVGGLLKSQVSKLLSSPELAQYIEQVRKEGIKIGHDQVLAIMRAAVALKGKE